MADSDERLMERMGREDLRALGELFDRHQPRLYGFLSRFLGDPATAEDVTQEVFVRVWRYRHAFNGSRSFRAWLYGIARHAALTEAEKRQRRAVPLSELGEGAIEAARDHEVEPGFADRVVAARSLHEQERVALQALPPDQRLCIILREYEERLLPVRAADPPRKGTVSLELRGTPLRTALEILFTQWGVQYAIEADVPDPPITLNVKEMPFEEALNTLLRLGATSVSIPGAGVAQALVEARTVNGMVVIRRVGSTAPGPPETNTDSVFEKVPIQFTRVQELVEQIRPQAINVSLQPLARENALLVRGRPEFIQELKSLLRMVDVPPKAIHLTVGVSAPGHDGRPLAIRSNVRTLAGGTAMVDDQASVGGQPARLKVSLQTMLQGNGSLQVASDWEISVPVAGGRRGPIRLVKRLSTTTSLPNARQTPVAQVDLVAWGGKGIVLLWIRGALEPEDRPTAIGRQSPQGASRPLRGSVPSPPSSRLRRE
jgi:RNA polymerase sigma factor (sigma-70 family)